MKKLVFLVSMMVAGATSLLAQSTDYKAFKVDVGGEYAIPSGDGAKAGIGFYLEPKYNITNNIAVGLKMETAIMAAESVAGASVDISAVNTYQFTGDYYFSNNYVRPFGGLGVGLYSLGSATFSAIDEEGNTADLTLDYGTKFGFAPRVGVLIGHFRLGLEYNVITGLESGVDKNYMALKLGWEIGGGKK